MKLRIRFGKKTKIINLQDEPVPTFSILKTAIKENAFLEWGLDLETDFQVSLNGKSSAGENEETLKNVGIVSGDLLKVLTGDNAIPISSSSTSVEEEKDTSASMATSEMSVTSEEPGTSSGITFEEIPCVSPGPVFFRECDGQSNVPHLLQKIYEDDSIKNEFQALCIALHFMMCESGYYIEGINEHLDILSMLQPRLFSVEYSNPSAAGELKFNFTCNQLGSFVLVNGVAQPCRNTSEQVLTLQITTNDYVNSFNATNKNSNAATVYKNLSKLNRLVKETIAHPALNNMREELQLPPTYGLLSLFPEILQLILSQLNFKSLVALSRTSKALHEIASDDNLWRNLYIRDFKSHPVDVGTSWKAVYQKRFVREKVERQERESSERRYRDYQTEGWPQFPTPGPGGMPVPYPEQPFGMIGGEHDLNPSFPYGPFANPRRPPNHPVHPRNPDNPLPGSRFDPIYPGGFRPGRGGGMMDDDLSGFGAPMMPFQNQRGRRSRHNPGFGFM